MIYQNIKLCSSFVVHIDICKLTVTTDIFGVGIKEDEVMCKKIGDWHILLLIGMRRCIVWRYYSEKPDYLREIS